MYKLQKKIGYILSLSVLFYVGIVATGFCGEFINKRRSLSLEDDPPSQKQSTILDSPAQNTNSDSVYNEFEQKIKKISPDKKNEIKNAFKRKLNEAQNGNRWDEVSYYGKLIEILEKSN